MIRAVSGPRLAPLQIIVVTSALMLLGLVWRTESAFVAAIDHGDRLFQDFAFVYYPTVRDTLREGAPAGGFFYPAAFAAMLAPLAPLSFGAAKVVWAAVLFAAMGVLAVPLARAAAGPDRPELALVGAALTATSVPVLHDLRWGQVSLPIIALVGLTFVLYTAKREWPAAALLAVAAGMKGYPLVFAGYFLLKGDLRFCARVAAACLVTLVLLPALVLGPAHALFVQRVSTSSVLGAQDGVVYDFNSQWAPAVYARYHAGWDAIGADGRASAKLASAGALAVVVLLTAVVARSSSPRIAARRELLGFVLIASSVPFWLKTSWSHYFVHLPVAQTLALRLFSEPRLRAGPSSLATLLCLVAPSVLLATVPGLLLAGDWLTYADAGSVFFANAFLLLAFAVYVLDAAIPARLRRRAADAASTLTPA